MIAHRALLHRKAALVAAFSLSWGLAGSPAGGEEPASDPSSAPSVVAAETEEAVARPAAPVTTVEKEKALAEYVEERSYLVNVVLAGEIGDRQVLDALLRVPRHRFVPSQIWSQAYVNRPLPIGEDQTISQPLIVALMTQLLQLDENKKVLEVGTGSGYQAAVLAELAGEVYSIEIVEPLGRRAARVLEELGYGGVRLRIGDGYRGWPEAAPFDGIIVTCAPDHIPGPLQEQLAEGGRLVIPVGGEGQVQELVLVEKREGRLVREDIIPVRFVPMTGPGVEEEAD